MQLSIHTKRIKQFSWEIRCKPTVGSIKTQNVAAAMLTAALPPFVRSGMKIDVKISTIGDAKKPL